MGSGTRVSVIHGFLPWPPWRLAAGGWHRPARSGKVAAMLERFRVLTSTGLRGAAGLLPAERLRAVQVVRFVLRTLADAIEPLEAPPRPNLAGSPPRAPGPTADG